MRKTITSLLLVLLALPMTAAERPEHELKSIALAQLTATMQQDGPARAPIMLGDVKRIMQTSTYSVFTHENAGHFVIISNDDRFTPVLAIASGNFNLDEAPCCMKWWLKKIDTFMQDVIQGTTEYQSFASSKTYTAVAPLLTTKWGQGDPFNRKAPAINNQRAPAGCVAIAMAQILNYNKYPASANFIGSYTVSGGSKKTETVSESYTWNFFDTYSYYFPDGSDQYVTVSRGNVSSNRVATLAYDCALAVGMQYTPSGSGAYTMDTGPALIEKFSYPEETVKHYERAYYTAEEWLDMIAEELQRGYPIIYAGSDPEQGGHAFVVNGMNENGLAYVNWGWNGQFDGYYEVSLMNAGGENQFSESQAIVTCIHPTALPTDHIESLFYTATPYAFSYDNSTQNLTFTLTSGVYNYGTRPFKGALAIVFEDVTTGEKEYDIFNNEEQTVQVRYGFGAQDLEAKVEFDAGHSYRLTVVSKDENEDEWQTVRTVGGPIYWDVTVDAAGAVTIADNPIYTAIESVPLLSGNDHSAAAPVRYYDLQGREVDASHRGLTIVRQGNRVQKVVR